jgi:hypothetical protein
LGHRPRVTLKQCQGEQNGVLCYLTSALDSRRHDDGRRFAEEPSLLKGEFVAQHPDILRVHLALAHPGNTVNKDMLYQSLECHTELQLSQLPTQAEDQAFYRALTASEQFVERAL